MLEVRNISKSYGGASGRQRARGVGLAVQPGEYVAIVGESGVGKSTLLNLIAGLDVPDSGEILLEGRDLASLDETARPLAELSSLYREVVLMDVVCLPEIRKKIKAYRNAAFVEHDVTNVAERLYQNGQNTIRAPGA